MSTLTDNFKNITGYDIEKFFNDYNYFVSVYYSKIVNYYNGQNIDKDSFNYFDNLRIEANKITAILEINFNAFNTVDFWDLTDTFTNIVVKLDTIDNLGRWMRSSRTDRFSSETAINYVQKQGETIERISQKAGSSNKENDWVNISIENDLNEEKYTSTGGVLLKVKLKNAYNFEIRNVVDSFSNENLYGKDIKNKIEFASGDVVTLAGETSLMQTVENIVNCLKGSIPEYQEDGLDNDLIGSNVSSFNYPAQFRNLLNMVQKDDRFKSIDLIDVGQEQDGVYMKIQLTTKIGDLIKKELAL